MPHMQPTAMPDRPDMYTSSVMGVQPVLQDVCAEQQVLIFVAGSGQQRMHTCRWTGTLRA